MLFFLLTASDKRAFKLLTNILLLKTEFPAHEKRLLS